MGPSLLKIKKLIKGMSTHNAKHTAQHIMQKAFFANLKNLNGGNNSILKQRRQDFLKWIHYKNMMENEFFKQPIFHYKFLLQLKNLY